MAVGQHYLVCCNNVYCCVDVVFFFLFNHSHRSVTSCKLYIHSTLGQSSSVSESETVKYLAQWPTCSQSGIVQVSGKDCK